MFNKLAEHLMEGEIIQHSGTWIEVAAIRVGVDYVTVAAMCGGCVSFPVGCLVRVKRNKQTRVKP